jgi:hypothetical protein
MVSKTSQSQRQVLHIFFHIGNLWGKEDMIGKGTLLGMWEEKRAEGEESKNL